MGASGACGVDGADGAEDDWGAGDGKVGATACATAAQVINPNNAPPNAGNSRDPGCSETPTPPC